MTAKRIADLMKYRRTSITWKYNTVFRRKPGKYVTTSYCDMMDRVERHKSPFNADHNNLTANDRYVFEVDSGELFRQMRPYDMIFFHRKNTKKWNAIASEHIKWEVKFLMLDKFLPKKVKP